MQFFVDKFFGQSSSRKKDDQLCIKRQQPKQANLKDKLSYMQRILWIVLNTRLLMSISLQYVLLANQQREQILDLQKSLIKGANLPGGPLAQISQLA